MSIGVIKSLRLAFWGGTSLVRGAWYVTANPIETAKSTRNMSLRGVLSTFDSISALGEQPANAEFLNKSVAILQMGRLAIYISYDDDNRTDADIVNMDHLEPGEANRIAGADLFYSSVLHESFDSKKPNISLLVNTVNFTKNADKICSDAAVEALTFSLKRIRYVGWMVAKVTHWTVRPIADYVIGTIINQAKNVIDLMPSSPFVISTACTVDLSNRD